MLILSIFGVAFAVGIGFLLFAYRGFAADKRHIRRKENAVQVVSLEPTRIHRRKTGISGLLFLAIGVLPVVASAHADAQSGSTTNLPAVTQASDPAQPSKSNATASPEPKAAPVPPTPNPATTGPLTMPAPERFDAGPFGPLAITGILSGFGYWQGHPEKSDQAARADLSNAAIFVQRTKGLVQFFVQAGAYNLPALGSPIPSTATTVKNSFGPLPVAYLRISPNESFSLLIGKLPTLMGMENTFTFQNFNIERGLLWNQTNAIARGVQLNYATKKLSASLSWNDGFYSNRYNWLTGSATATLNKTSALELIAGGNLGSTGYSSIATPLYQNNSRIVDVAYTHTANRWLIEPYVQYTRVPSDRRIHVDRTTDTFGGAVFASYTFRPRLSLAGRVEYIGNSGNPGNDAANLVYGPGSRAWSLALTPTYQRHSFFARGEFSFVQAFDAVRGDAFGQGGDNSSQARFMIETGVMF